jgi:hypothetical protein
MQKIILVIITFWYMLLPSLALGKQSSIVGIERVFHIESSNEARLDLVITNRKSEPVYKILCRPDDYEDADFDYTGLLQCRLISIKKGVNPVDTDLLSQPEATRDWLSRSLFDIRHLTGNCRDDRDFGSVRTFKLRGMKITLRLFNLNEHASSPLSKSSNKFYSYDFSIDVVNDKHAKSRTDRLVPWPQLKDNELDCKSKSPWR